MSLNVLVCNFNIKLFTRNIAKSFASYSDCGLHSDIAFDCSSNFGFDLVFLNFL